MLNRRYLRVKVLQALYAHLQSHDSNIVLNEKEMLKSIDRIYDLYLYILLLFEEIVHVANLRIEHNKEKRLPTEEDLNPITKFVDNRLVRQLSENVEFRKLIESKKINWQSEPELVKKLYTEIAKSDEYAGYMNPIESSYNKDKDFIIEMFKRFICDSELLHQHLEEKSIYWMDDFVLVSIHVVKTLQAFNEGTKGAQKVLMGLYKDEKDDRLFIRELFAKTIANNAEYEVLIADKTKNWEIERIAVMDVLLMKMAICEMQYFNSIPVKVSLNEYIEISKSYSTPKSKVFINGILDKIAAQLKREGKIVKVGRGLVE